MTPSENRLHDASLRKIGTARRAGYVAQSRDLAFAVVLLAACISLAFAGRSFVGGLVVFMRDALRGASGVSLWLTALDAGVRAAASALACPLGAIVFLSLAMGLVQTRGLFRSTVVSPDPIRLVARLRRLFGADSVFAAGTGVAKTLVLGLVSAAALAGVAPALFELWGSPPARVLEGLLVISKSVGITMTLAMLGLGGADYLWQMRRYSKSLRMSADEVRREQRESEGVPLLKCERTRLRWELLRAVAKLAEADVVVTNPHVLAVALRFAPELAPAPTVVRKGRAAAASDIVMLAAKTGVPVVVMSDLAAALDESEEGDEIPEWLYERVAELIADARCSTAVAEGAKGRQTASEVLDGH